MKKLFLLIAVSLCLLNCKPSPKQILPQIMPSSYDTLFINNEIEMKSAWPLVYAMNINQNDTVDLNVADTIYWDNYSDFGLFHNNKSKELAIYADGSDIDFHAPLHSDYTFIIPPPMPENPTEAQLKEFDSIYLSLQEKTRRIHTPMIPVYIYNPSNYPIEIDHPIAGGSLFMIVEAKDEKGFWKPIEYMEQFRFLCGTGHQDLLLKSKKWLVAGVKRYEGSFATQARVKLANRDSAYYSNVFDMSVNPSQFFQKKVIDSISEQLDFKRIDLLKKRLFLD